ncbi:MAG TPA: DUF2231 domain-containing protein, partial [Candidatus Thermoplasmatota archaeon]|nr:DUF2231 domain-containing protein [Candidatus Thermoplasmatota archaeon]
MRSRARIFRHPLHPMLVVFPTAIFPLLLFLDVLRALGAAIGPSVPFWLAVAGVATTLAAIVPGVIDLAAIPDRSRAHRVAFVHFVVGTVTLAAYAAAAWTRWPAGPDRVGL